MKFAPNHEMDNPQTVETVNRVTAYRVKPDIG